jgi:hypothetical protein
LNVLGFGEQWGIVKRIKQGDLGLWNRRPYIAKNVNQDSISRAIQMDDDFKEMGEKKKDSIKVDDYPNLWQTIGSLHGVGGTALFHLSA